jgi:hypothetical protein
MTPRHGLNEDVDWLNAVTTGEYGCGECQWEGMRRELEALGIDGEPLPVIHPGQIRMEAS